MKFTLKGIRNKQNNDIMEKTNLSFDENPKGVQSTKETTKGKVRINIFETLGKTPVMKHTFIAELTKDPKDRISYLRNDEYSFLEVYPQRDEDLDIEIPGKDIKEQTNTMNVAINNLNKKLKDVKKDRDFNTNEKDLELQIRRLKAKRRMLVYPGLENYFVLGAKGVKMLFYHDKGSELIPINWDLDNKYTIYTDILAKRKYSSMASANLLHKYQDKIKKAMDTGQVWLFAILIVWTCAMLAGSGFMFKKYQDINDKYDKSNMAELERQAAAGSIMCSKYLGDSAKAFAFLIENEAKQQGMESQIKERKEISLDSG